MTRPRRVPTPSPGDGPFPGTVVVCKQRAQRREEFRRGGGYTPVTPAEEAGVRNPTRSGIRPSRGEGNARRHRAE